jgi:hypothetical protein
MKFPWEVTTMARLLRITTGATLLTLVCATAALAGGGKTIKDAPTLSFGVQYFGNTQNGSEDDPGRYYEFWRLPLIAGDTVTVDFENAVDGAGVHEVTIYPAATTDYNLSSAKYTYWYMPQNQHGEAVYRAPSTGTYPLVFDGYRSSLGAYDFTAYVKHEVRLQAQASSLRSRGTWVVGVRYPDGSPVDDPALSLLLYAKIGHDWRAVGKGTPKSGKAVVGYTLPLSSRGHVVRLRLVASGKSYRRVALSQSVQIS